MRHSPPQRFFGRVFVGLTAGPPARMGAGLRPVLQRFGLVSFLESMLFENVFLIS